MMHIENIPIIRFNIRYDNDQIIYFDMLDKSVKVGSIINIFYGVGWPLDNGLRGGSHHLFLKKKKCNKFIWDLTIENNLIESFFNLKEEFKKDQFSIEDYIEVKINPSPTVRGKYVPYLTLNSFKCCFEKKVDLEQKENHWNFSTGYAFAPYIPLQTAPAVQGAVINEQNVQNTDAEWITSQYTDSTTGRIYTRRHNRRNGSFQETVSDPIRYYTTTW